MVRTGVVQGCSWGTLFFNVAYARVIRKLNQKYKGKALFCTISDDTAIPAPDPTAEDGVLIKAFEDLKEMGAKELNLRYGNLKDAFLCYDPTTATTLQSQLLLHSELTHITVSSEPFKIGGAWVAGPGATQTRADALKMALQRDTTKHNRRMHLIDSIGLKSQTKLYYLRLCATPTSMLMHTLRSLPSSVSQEGMQAAHDRLKPVVARAFSQPETIFDDHKDTKLEERVFNRRLEGGCGITKITTIAAVAHAARLLDVLPRTVKLPWQTTNETQVDDWRNSQSASLREAHATLLGLSAVSNQQTLHEVGSKTEHKDLWLQISREVQSVSDRQMKPLRVLDLDLLQNFVLNRPVNSYVYHGPRIHHSLQRLFSQTVLRLERKRHITDNPDLSLQHKQMDIENRAFNANLWVTASPRFPLSDSDVATNFALAWLVPNPALDSRFSKCLPTCKEYSAIPNHCPHAVPDTSMTYYDKFWSIGVHATTCAAAGLYRRHNDFLRFALARALLDYMGWA